MRWAFAYASIGFTDAQFHFMGDGQMFQMGGQPKQAEWPPTVNPKIASEFEFLVNTRWKSQKKRATYSLLKGGIAEGPKECQHHGSCLWAANNAKVYIITTKLKEPLEFSLQGAPIGKLGVPKKNAAKSLENGDEKTLEQITLESTTVAKSGKKSVLVFDGVVKSRENEQESSLIAEDLYTILDIDEQAEAADIKRKYRKLSISNHPDKGGSEEKFNMIREAYEVLSDPSKRDYYEKGGMLLVRNIEMAWKESEGQEAQMQEQLKQIPRNHPMRAQAEAQIKQQTDKARIKREIEKKMTDEDVVVPVSVPLSKFHTGGVLDDFLFERVQICRGCRADPSAEKCQDCSACPPEKRQIPQQGPFGMIVGMHEVEVESKERCRKVPLKISGLRLSSGAKDGAYLGSKPKLGHQTPGRIPGGIKLVASMAEDPTYTVVGKDLYTVMHLSLADITWGFTKIWNHFDGHQLQLVRENAFNNQVLKVAGRGLKHGKRGDLYIRLKVEMPKPEKGETSFTITKKHNPSEAVLVREGEVEFKEGAVWKRWLEAERARQKKPVTVTDLNQAIKDEL